MQDGVWHANVYRKVILMKGKKRKQHQTRKVVRLHGRPGKVFTRPMGGLGAKITH